jgi:hypothetical protein
MPTKGLDARFSSIPFCTNILPSSIRSIARETFDPRRAQKRQRTKHEVPRQFCRQNKFSLEKSPANCREYYVLVALAQKKEKKEVGGGGGEFIANAN